MIIRPYFLPKRPVFSRSLVSGPEYTIFVEKNILKILQRLETATK